MTLGETVKREYKKELSTATDSEIYTALLKLIASMQDKRKKEPCGKKLYYISAEFLIGKLLSNNLINLGIYDSVKRELAAVGKELSHFEDLENEPSLGNGGLGRLAACFLDSIATLGLNGDGIGLCYHFGLFRQIFRENTQEAEPDKWITDSSWLTKTDRAYQVDFGGLSVNARMYDIAISGYESVTRTLHLFDLEGVDESIVKEGISFDKGLVDKNLTLFLYPDDSDASGKLLRLYQQYFMVSAAAQLIIDECLSCGARLEDISKYAVIAINDTHPAMIIPEMIRLLCKRGLSFDGAINSVSGLFAYTNHTILAEALEKWKIEYIKAVVPDLVPIIEALDDRVRRRYKKGELYIIDNEERVCMASMAIHYSFSVNGVASLHTDILKKSELKSFYEIYPNKFNNKTNGITFRRWLLSANPELSDFISELIGDRYKYDAEKLKELLKFKDDEALLNRLLEIKALKKRELKEYLLKEQGIEINENSIFDIQIKRLHEYKRQQLNALFVIHTYLEIKEGRLPPHPITVIFGAKAAPAYIIAQDIIHLILCLSELIEADSEVKKLLRVVMVENYNVTKAEKLIPAADISEQISLASKEASGTGNMKLMLNGAVTLGTLDGANVEIHSLVGDDNIYIFGSDSQTVVERYKRGDYSAKEYYEKNHFIKRALDFITSEKMLALGDKERLERLSRELISKDWFMTFPDFDSYIAVKKRAFEDYGSRLMWAKKMLVNIAMSGYFSSDRTIKEYTREIWKL